jgi:hypothetical protein
VAHTFVQKCQLMGKMYVSTKKHDANQKIVLCLNYLALKVIYLKVKFRKKSFDTSVSRGHPQMTSRHD